MIPGLSYHSTYLFIFSTGLYTTFWQLSLYDICDLGETYEKQCQRLRNVVIAAQNAHEEALNQPNIDIAIRRKRRTDAEIFARVCPAAQQKLRQEKEIQSKDHRHVWKRLQREKYHWFRKQLIPCYRILSLIAAFPFQLSSKPARNVEDQRFEFFNVHANVHFC